MGCHIHACRLGVSATRTKEPRVRHQRESRMAPVAPLKCTQPCWYLCPQDCWCECHTGPKAGARMPLVAESDGTCYRRYHNTHPSGNGEQHEDHTDGERTVRMSRTGRLRSATGGSGTRRDLPPTDQ